MSKLTDQLRFNGFSVDGGGRIECARIGVTDKRYQHERCAVVRFDFSETASKPMRELVARAVSHLDEPRSIMGTARNGSVLILFRVDTDGELVEPVNRSGQREAVHSFEYQGEPGVVTIGSIGQFVTVADWTWLRDRSPLNVARDALPALVDDMGTEFLVQFDALGAVGVATPPNWYAIQQREAQRKFEVDCAAQGQDSRLVRLGLTQAPENPDTGWSDGIAQGLAYQARKLAATLRS